MIRSALIAMVIAGISLSAHAQRIELEGGNSGSAGSGLLGLDTERDLNGGLTIDLGRDGIGVEAGGEISLGLDDERETLGGGISIGAQTDSPPASVQNGAGGNDTLQPGAPVSAEPEMTDPDGGAVTCSDRAAFDAQRETFLEQEPLETLAYIQRVDVSVCGYEGSDRLIARLNTIEGVRQGLDHMEIEPETIVSARWTDDQGLLVYTAGPAD